MERPRGVADIEEVVRRFRSDRGAVLVESAIIVPLIALLLFGIVEYGLVVSREWVARGRPDTCAAQIAEFAAAEPLTQAQLAERGLLPPWLGDEAFHLAHRSSLLRKDPEWYRPLFPDVPDDLEYVWPVPK